MKHLAQVFFAGFWKLGGAGLLILGVLDSSFIFAPLGNDLLVVAMTARSHSLGKMLYYAAMSTVGSVLGCLLVDVIFRKAGEEGLVKHLPRKRFEYVKRKVDKSAAWALVLASIAPPPFPFTPFIMATSALQYPRERELSLVAAARMFRFTVIGLLALRFGTKILRWADNDIVQYSMIALLILCVAGTGISIYGWVKRSRTPGKGGTAQSGKEQKVIGPSREQRVLH